LLSPETPAEQKRWKTPLPTYQAYPNT
jgi:hypothetical protein